VGWVYWTARGSRRWTPFEAYDGPREMQASAFGDDFGEGSGKHEG